MDQAKLAKMQASVRIGMCEEHKGKEKEKENARAVVDEEREELHKTNN